MNSTLRSPVDRMETTPDLPTSKVPSLHWAREIQPESGEITPNPGIVVETSIEMSIHFYLSSLYLLPVSFESFTVFSPHPSPLPAGERERTPLSQRERGRG